MVRHITIAAWHNRLAVAAALLLSGAVAAQAQTPVPPVESVTVEAPKDAKPTPFLTGGSRWQLSICPTVIGLTPEQNQRVRQRVMQVAELVGGQPLQHQC